jgi:iron-sulfur cluster assembly protein
MDMTPHPPSAPIAAGGGETPVRLSERAARRIGRICSGQPEGTLLRLEVIGGGCSGFSYRFGLTPVVNADDLVVERDGARVAIDEASLPFLAGSEIDFTDELIGSSFQVLNPNAKSGCGCGTSFSI